MLRTARSSGTACAFPPRANSWRRSPPASRSSSSSSWSCSCATSSPRTRWSRPSDTAWPVLATPNHRWPMPAPGRSRRSRVPRAMPARARRRRPHRAPDPEPTANNGPRHHARIGCRGYAVAATFAPGIPTPRRLVPGPEPSATPGCLATPQPSTTNPHAHGTASAPDGPAATPDGVTPAARTRGRARGCR